MHAVFATGEGQFVAHTYERSRLPRACICMRDESSCIKGEGTVHSYNTNEWAVYDTTSGRKEGRTARGERKPVWRVRFPRSAISRVADAHGTKGGAGDEGGRGEGG